MIKEMSLLCDSSIAAVTQGQSRSVLGVQDTGSFYENMRLRRRRNEIMKEIKKGTPKSLTAEIITEGARCP